MTLVADFTLHLLAGWAVLVAAGLGLAALIR